MPFKEIDYNIKIWHALVESPYSIFLDGCERYSYILINPSKIWQQWGQWGKVVFDKYENLPPFQGGIAGFLSYELGHLFNKSSYAEPKVLCGLYDQVFAFDHKLEKAWKIWRYDEPIIPKAVKLEPLKFGKIQHDFGPEKYMDLIREIQNKILAGDVYQVNISERYSLNASFKPNDIYHELRTFCKAPFSCFANLGDMSIISASPERFLKIENNIVTSSPIKGTIARLEQEELDLINIQKLKNSKKDYAENAMIVDLMRNDLSKFCEPNSIQVSELCGLYTFSNVHHLISTIKGRIRPDLTVFDALKSCISAGSITGAPKLMAMQIIAQMEQRPRVSYCGNMFWTDGHGNLDSNILIRTIEANGTNLSFRAGAGITHLSDPESELQEVIAKARDLTTLCSQ